MSGPFHRPQIEREDSAADVHRLGSDNGGRARHLARRRNTTCRRKGGTAEVLAYNFFVVPWLEVTQPAATEPNTSVGLLETMFDS